MERPSQSRYANPLNICPVASVRINGVRPNLIARMPLKSPATTPMTSVTTNASHSGMSEDIIAKEMARRSRGTPRLANRILKRVRDFAQVKYDGIITEEVARTALDLMDVDKMGLDHIDRNILVTIIEKFDGGPVGLDTLAAAIGEDAGTIEDVYEPYLIKNGFLNRTPKGRVVTDLTYHHLGLN